MPQVTTGLGTDDNGLMADRFQNKVLRRPEIYMDLKVVVVLMDALLFAADLAGTPEGKDKVRVSTGCSSTPNSPQLAHASCHILQQLVGLPTRDGALFLPSKVDAVVECCICLCKAVCGVTAASYGPCARIKSSSELVHGVPAHIAVAHLIHVQNTLTDVYSG
jgi:hypothetical protein